LLDDLKGRASVIIDTTELSPKARRERMFSLYSGGRAEWLATDVLRIGASLGRPVDADFCFAARLLPTPSSIPAYRSIIALENEVYDYVIKWQDTDTFYEKLFDMIKYLIPQYIKEGKSQLTIAIGCTGGQHRSVALTERLGADLKNIFSFTVNTTHRDAMIEGTVHEKN